jgi:hypothetical protein
MTAYSTSSQVYVTAGLSATEVSGVNVEQMITYADAEIDSLFKRSFANGTVQTEYVSVYLPKRADDIAPNRIVLSKYPVQSITSFILVDSTGTTTTTLSTITVANIVDSKLQTTDYFLNPETGIIELNSRTLQFAPSRAKIGYTYGYSGTPAYIQELSTLLAGIRIWVEFAGGSYDRLNSYKLPEQEFVKGDFTVRVTDMVERMKRRAQDIESLIGEKYKSQFYATSGGYF